MADLLSLSGVSRQFGGLRALQDVTLRIGKGEVLGLIGPNGAGKTTLVNVITGVHHASQGSVQFLGRDISRIRPYQAARSGLARTFQVVQPFPEMTVLENVAAAALFSQPRMRLAAARDVAARQLEFVGIGALADKRAASLTLAMRKRLELAKALSMQPKILFLDEVNAGLNSAEVQQAVQLVHRIAASGVTIVLIEHLMKVVLSICQRIVVLQNGALIADGKPDAIVQNPEVIAAYLGKKYAQRSMTQGAAHV